MEMGAKRKGDVKHLCKFFKPHFGILTAIGKQHLESFGSIENIVLTKSELQENLDKNGCMVFNCNNELVRKKFEDCDIEKISVGINDDNKIYYSIKKITFQSFY